MTRQQLDQLCGRAPLLLSLMACVWVLGNVAGGARSGGAEGIGFHIFWLLVLAQLGFIAVSLMTADWHRVRPMAGRTALHMGCLMLAFLPVAYFGL